MSGILTLDKVHQTYEALKKEVRKAVSKGNYEKAFHIIDGYALIVQELNDHFRENEFEDLFKKIAESFFNVGDYCKERDEKTVIFYDQIGTTICLGLQYLRALWNKGYNVIYVYESPEPGPVPELIEEVRKHCTIVKIFEGRSSIEKGKEIVEFIKASKASKIITHCSSYGSLCASILYAIKEIKKYRIVPGDHHFNLGVECYDYFFDYRDFAIQISIDERKIPVNKIYKLPYYPIIENSIPFAGFPKEAEGKIKILTAGAEYKYHGSDWFYQFSKWVLEHTDNVVILFLGGKSPLMLDFVSKNHFEDKFLLLGYRKDFIACMKQVDVFLNSYPMGGGLVGLTAVNLGIPVLSYYDEFNAKQNSMRSFMGAEDIDSPISFSDDAKIKEYALKLLSDVDYRQKEGMRMKDMTQTQVNFEKMLDNILMGDIKTLDKSPCVNCHLEKRLDNYLSLQDDFQPSLLIRLNLMFGPVFIFKYPHLYAHIWRHRKAVLGMVAGEVVRKLLPKETYIRMRGKMKKYFY